MKTSLLTPGDNVRVLASGMAPQTGVYVGPHELGHQVYIPDGDSLYVFGGATKIVWEDPTTGRSRIDTFKTRKAYGPKMSARQQFFNVMKFMVDIDDMDDEDDDLPSKEEIDQKANRLIEHLRTKGLIPQKPWPPTHSPPNRTPNSSPARLAGNRRKPPSCILRHGIRTSTNARCAGMR